MLGEYEKNLQEKYPGMFLDFSQIVENNPNQISRTNTNEEIKKTLQEMSQPERSAKSVLDKMFSGFKTNKN
jgi:hypothetical protein